MVAALSLGDCERSFNLIDEVELAKVDVFRVRNVGYQAAALARSVKLELQPGDPFSQVDIASAEDTIVAKPHWYRKGEEVSDRQWRDIQGVLLAQRDRLDFAYIRLWAEHFGLTDLLERLLASIPG